MTQNELDIILKAHKRWLSDKKEDGRPTSRTTISRTPTSGAPTSVTLTSMALTSGTLTSGALTLTIVVGRFGAGA